MFNLMVLNAQLLQSFVDLPSMIFSLMFVIFVRYWTRTNPPSTVFTACQLRSFWFSYHFHREQSHDAPPVVEKEESEDEDVGSATIQFAESLTCVGTSFLI